MAKKTPATIQEWKTNRSRTRRRVDRETMWLNLVVWTVIALMVFFGYRAFQVKDGWLPFGRRFNDTRIINQADDGPG